MDGFIVWAREVDLNLVRTLETLHGFIDLVYGRGQWAHRTEGTRMVVWTKVQNPPDLSRKLWEMGA